MVVPPKPNSYFIINIGIFPPQSLKYSKTLADLGVQSRLISTA